MIDKSELNNLTESEQLETQEGILATWKKLLNDIEQGNAIVMPLSFDIQNLLVVTEATKKKFREIEKVIKKVLQHPKCPHLTFNIELNNQRPSSVYNNKRPPFAIIFEPLTSGQCIARGLTINLIGQEAHVLPQEMDVLVKGLTEGKCPENLTINFKTLSVAVKPGDVAQTHAWALKEALEQPNCPSGLQIKFKPVFESLSSQEAIDKYGAFIELCNNGNYDRMHIRNKIDDIHNAIEKELNAEIKRLGNKDTARSDIINALKKNIESVRERQKQLYNNCDSSETYKWKTTLKTELEDIIKLALEKPSIIKNHTDFEKYGKYLLNIITGLIFPLAIIKYATTGSLFYSTVGKSHETVEKVLTMTQNIKP